MSIRLYILMAFGGLVALVLLIVGIGFLVGYLVGFMVDKCSKVGTFEPRSIKMGLNACESRSEKTVLNACA